MKRFGRCEIHGLEGMGCDTGECPDCESGKPGRYENKKSHLKLGEVVEFLQENIPCFVEKGKAKRYFYIADIDDVEILAHRLLTWFKERKDGL